MGIELPQGSEIFIPEVPAEIQQQSPQLFEFLQSMKRQLEELSRGSFDNDDTIRVAIDSGTSGTFTISSGGSIVVTSGIVINVTS